MTGDVFYNFFINYLVFLNLHLSLETLQRNIFLNPSNRQLLRILSPDLPQLYLAFIYATKSIEKLFPNVPKCIRKYYALARWGTTTSHATRTACGLGNANMGATGKQSDLRKPQFFGLPNEANRCVS